MMKSLKILFLSMNICLAIITHTPAAIIDVTLTIDNAPYSLNPYDNPRFLTSGDTFTWTVTYNELLVPGAGEYSIQPIMDPTMDINGPFGAFPLLDIRDAFLWPINPNLHFKDTVLDGILFFAFLDELIPNLLLCQTIINGDQLTSKLIRNGGPDEIIYTGHITFPGTGSQVPEPATFLLFGIGFLSLAGLGRKPGIG